MNRAIDTRDRQGHRQGRSALFPPDRGGTLLGDPSKARTKLGWTPQISFDELVAEMVAGDLNRRDATP